MLVCVGFIFFSTYVMVLVYVVVASLRPGAGKVTEREVIDVAAKTYVDRSVISYQTNDDGLIRRLPKFAVPVMVILHREPLGKCFLLFRGEEFANQ